MLRFDVWVKYGNRWSYKAVYEASCSRSAALRASYVYGRKVIRVRPEGCPSGYVYRFQYVASLASGV